MGGGTVIVKPSDKKVHGQRRTGLKKKKKKIVCQIFGPKKILAQTLKFV